MDSYNCSICKFLPNNAQILSIIYFTVIEILWIYQAIRVFTANP